MINKIEIPSKDDLSELVSEALQSRSEAEFIGKHLKGVNDVLTLNPSHYRLYGCYWWPIKALLKEHGFDFGDEDEPATREHFSYDEPVYLLCAAWAYSNHRVEQGMMVPTLHQFEIEDELFDYQIEDLDMEAKIVNALA